MPALSHSKFSPSSSKFWLNCPASASLLQKVPDTVSKAAQSGTLSHDLIERFVKEYGLYYFEDLNDFNVGTRRAKDADRLAAEKYDSFCKLSAMGRNKMTKNLYNNMRQVANMFLKSRTPFFAVLDYKFGYRPVPSDSPQLILYLLGAMTKYRSKRFNSDFHLYLEDKVTYTDIVAGGYGTSDVILFRGPFDTTTTYHTILVQPTLNDAPLMSTFTKKQLDTKRKEYKKSATKCLSGYNTHVVGDWCEDKYAKCKNICPKYAEMERKKARDLFLQFDVDLEGVGDA
jgi:hypothetical protein